MLETAFFQDQLINKIYSFEQKKYFVYYVCIRTTSKKPQRTCVLANCRRRWKLQVLTKGACVKYVGGGAGGFCNVLKKKFRSPGDRRPKYFMAQ